MSTSLSALKGAKFGFATHVIPSVDVELAGETSEEVLYNTLSSQFEERGLKVSHGIKSDDGKMSLYFDGQDPNKVMQAVADMWRATR